MHAERCPVCSGHARLQGTTCAVVIVAEPCAVAPGTQICHGCFGRGWVAVLDVADTIALRNDALGSPDLPVPPSEPPPPERPQPTRVVFSQDLIERILRDGKLERYTEPDGTMVVTGIGWGNIYIGAKS